MRSANRYNEIDEFLAEADGMLDRGFESALSEGDIKSALSANAKPPQLDPTPIAPTTNMDQEGSDEAHDVPKLVESLPLAPRRHHRGTHRRTHRPSCVLIVRYPLVSSPHMVLIMRVGQDGKARPVYAHPVTPGRHPRPLQFHGLRPGRYVVRLVRSVSAGKCIVRSGTPNALTLIAPR